MQNIAYMCFKIKKAEPNDPAFEDNKPSFVSKIPRYAKKGALEKF